MSSGSGASQTTSLKSYKQDGKTTYCYYIDAKYTDDLAAIEPTAVTARGIGSECPVQLTVSVPGKVSAKSLIQMTMKAVVNEKAASLPKGFQFNFPVSKALVPEPLRATSNNASAGDVPLDKALFDVSVANFGVCDYRNCDIFTDFANIKGNYFYSSNNPQNFDTRVATFGSKEISISKESKYTGFAHVVVSVAGIARSDYVTFFPVQVGDLPGAEPSSSIAADSKTTYCWVTKGASPFEPRIEDASITVRTNANCPGTMSAALSKSSVLVGEKVSIEYSMQLEPTRDATTIVGEVSPTAAIKDPTTGVYSVVPVSVFSSCLQNSEDTKTSCSTYSGGKSRTKDIQTWTNQNLTSSFATFSSSQTFDSPGQYLIISRVVMQTVDGDRVDMAVYSNLQVTIPVSSSGSLFLYLGLGIGALILLLGLLFCYFRKRRQRNKMKQIPFRTPMPPSTHERTSQYTSTSSHFVTHRDPPMNSFPIAYPQHENNSYYPSDKGMQHDPRQHADSFSLDPYRRNSFNEMGDDESLDMTIRPSDASKFSFQTGYDDQSDWEYDTQSYRSNGQSDYSNGTRGTFNLHANAPGHLPIMEEDDRDGRRYQQQNNYGGYHMRA